MGNVPSIDCDTIFHRHKSVVNDIVMFRRRKSVNKAKLEHKLYLARENPEPVFDLTDCDLTIVPNGIYSLCRVFLKESLRLDNNVLSSLSGGGNLKDLHLLKILNISNNLFHSLPDDIYLLKNLQELYVNNNKLKKVCENICLLVNLKVLDVSNNSLKYLPENMGNLVNLKKFYANNNVKLKRLPKSLHKWRKIAELIIDGDNFEYPPQEVIQQEAQNIVEYICQDLGVPYTQLEETEKDEVDSEIIELDTSDSFQAKIWELENMKQQKMKEFLDIERQNEIMQKQEIELAQTSRQNKEKLLNMLTRQQQQFDIELNKIQQVKEYDRFRLIEQLQEAENNADIVIKQLLSLNKEPLAQLLEQEKQEEERLMAVVNRYNETIHKDDVLAAMQDILEQETQKFKQFDKDRLETTQTILERELENDTKLTDLLQNQDEHKTELIKKLVIDSDLQRAAVGTLLERGDARSWALLQQIHLVESQLAMLTNFELDRKKLQMDQHINDLCDKRLNLSILLIDLLEQQKERHSQLISTLQIMEEQNRLNSDDFWLRQYQNLLERLPEGLSHAQKYIDPALAQALLVNGVIHCLPFLAKLTQNQCNIHWITEDDLLRAGVTCGNDRRSILNAFLLYEKEKGLGDNGTLFPTAPVEAFEGASAPLPEHIKTISSLECVICLDMECQIIFVPCGHLCCCCQCSLTILDCPLCRTEIERKITVAS